MSREGLLVLTAAEVSELVRDADAILMEIVAAAYRVHGCGDSVVPHSSFLRFPGGRDRIMALPAYLGGDFEVAGMKWIASFPGNLALGLERASGLVVLNSLATGRPKAVIEGSVISAKRTAASAAVAARALHRGDSPTAIGVLGCGTINFETLAFLLHVWPGVERVVVCDSRPPRAERFVARAREGFGRPWFQVAADWRVLVATVDVLSIATTAMTPYLDELRGERLRTVLHLSLRDLAPTVVLAADNVVDDADHVCRAETSLHLAERLVGDRTFIRCALAEVLAGAVPAGHTYGTPTIFSPFGLGILDIAVAKLVCERAEARGLGTWVPFAAAAA
jgi:2,3-diaminopropionate biosynthesis protein SbnB